MTTPITKLPDGSAFLTSEVMSREEAMALPIEKRPLNYRVSSELYTKTFEAIGAASMCWSPKPSTEVFDSEQAAKIATDLCFTFAGELEKQAPTSDSPCGRPDQISLDAIAHKETDYKLWTDKRSGDGMAYLPIYERYFGPLRGDSIHMVEIGVNMGASILVWLEYFQKGRIYGVDIEPRTRPEHERYRFLQGDQMNKNFWKMFVENTPKLDIIIDDGGHTSGQIETTFWSLWPHLKSGGYYCIEDLGACYNQDCLTPGFGNHLEFIQLLQHRINMSRGDMESIHFYRELAIIRKK